MERAAIVCGACHSNPHQLALAAQNPHRVAGLNYVDCHSIHQPDKTRLPDRSTRLCLDCHAEIRVEFELLSSHPVVDGLIECVDCHAPALQLDAPFDDFSHRRCVACHGERDGPYLYEHPAANEFAVMGGASAACHRPHGSNFDRLLDEPTINCAVAVTPCRVT